NLVFGHKQEQRTHRQQFMNEFNQGVGALRRAAGHFALGTAERLNPTYERARSMAGRGWGTTRDTINPIYQSLRDTASQARPGRMGGAGSSSGGWLSGRRQSSPGWQQAFGLMRRAPKKQAG